MRCKGSDRMELLEFNALMAYLVYAYLSNSWKAKLLEHRPRKIDPENYSSNTYEWLLIKDNKAKGLSGQR